MIVVDHLACSSSIKMPKILRVPTPGKRTRAGGKTWWTRGVPLRTYLRFNEIYVLPGDVAADVRYLRFKEVYLFDVFLVECAIRRGRTSDSE
jgi:hypothetical protein